MGLYRGGRGSDGRLVGVLWGWLGRRRGLGAGIGIGTFGVEWDGEWGFGMGVRVGNCSLEMTGRKLYLNGGDGDEMERYEMIWTEQG